LEPGVTAARLVYFTALTSVTRSVTDRVARCECECEIFLRLKSDPLQQRRLFHHLAREGAPRKIVYTGDILYNMDTLSGEVSTRELRAQLSDVLGRTMYAGERIGITRHGKLAAVVISAADLEALEAFEMAQDVAAYRDAKSADDGQRVTLDELRRNPTL
jgi:prevent-host-death family protein